MTEEEFKRLVAKLSEDELRAVEELVDEVGIGQALLIMAAQTSRETGLAVGINEDVRSHLESFMRDRRSGLKGIDHAG